MAQMKTVVLFALVLPALALAGCGQGKKLNPPTEPAQAIDQPDVAPPATGSSGGGVAGTGPVSFVGRWAADVSWCANTNGENRPIEITPIRFETSQKSCHIYSVDETANGYLTVLQCRPAGQSRGAPQQERVQLSVVGQMLTLTWPDQGGAQVKLLKCTTLADIAPTKVDP
ncbi:hypothetical protein BH10PSE1_BH10PSE1_15470 [soil metagenome]